MRASVLIAAVMTIPLAIAAYAEPSIGIHIDSDLYAFADTIQVSLSALNDGPDLFVDVYLGLMTPTGAIYTLGGEAWSVGISPWLSGMHFPSGFSLDRTPFLHFGVPCDMPPINSPGGYAFIAVLTFPGTLDFVSQESVAQFGVFCMPTAEYYVDAEAGDDANDGSQLEPLKTIKRALADAAGTEGAPVTIRVAAGTYSQTTNGESFPLRMKSWVTISGEDPDNTILDAEGEPVHVVQCYDVEDATIEGFTITGSAVFHTWRFYPDAGAIYCHDSSVIIRNNRITGNLGIDGTTCGAGVNIYGGSVLIQGNDITGNSVEAFGGGICCDGSPAEISSNLFVSNEVFDRGGALHCDGSSPAVFNNTFIRNVAGLGGGIASSGDGCPDIFDCIIWETGDDLFNCPATYCCTEDDDAGEGNIHSDPMFVPGPHGDYYLDPNSPCIDAGSRSAEDAGLSHKSTQADGTPDTGTVDIGYHDAID
ncbi:MAG: DUF1565 domain-containing protein [Candidatus Coatesbacteria bacterium]|nr:DUF1565 domain-containing protein [Candidatus Coatesbacteria bacterium]